MPPYGEIIPTEDDIWKIIAWIRCNIASKILRELKGTELSLVRQITR